MTPAKQGRARVINRMVPEFNRVRKEALETYYKEVDQVIERRMSYVDEEKKVHYPHYKLGVSVKLWDIPMTEKLKYLGWSYATYKLRTRMVAFPDISSREGLKLRRDPTGSAEYLYRINYYLEKLGEPEWDSLPPAPVKKWSRRKPEPAKNESVEKPFPVKNESGKNQVPPKNG